MSSRGLDPDADVPQADGLEAAILGASRVALFENLYVAYAAEAHRHARALLGDPDLAADAVHTAFLEMLRYVAGGRRWNSPTQARSMVMRNVRWAALKVKRSRRRLSVGFEAPPQTGDDAVWARAEARALCELIIAQLRPAYELAIRYRYLEGWSSAEAARRLRISVHAYEMRLHRALRAARKAAARLDTAGGMLPPVAASVRWLHRRKRAMHRAMARGARVAVQAGAAGCAVTLVVHTISAPSHATAPQNIALTPVGATAAMLGGPGDASTIDDATLVDAIAVAPRTGATTVFALGKGKGCQCWEAFRSRDGGASWATAPAPGDLVPATRIATAAAFPEDPRLFLVDGIRATQVSAHFGAPFVRTTTGTHTGSGEHAEPCRRTSGALVCGAVRSGFTLATDDGVLGRLLVVTPARWLYLRPFGGVLCSADQGLSWRPRCLP